MVEEGSGPRKAKRGLKRKLYALWDDTGKGGNGEGCECEVHVGEIWCKFGR